MTTGHDILCAGDNKLCTSNCMSLDRLTSLAMIDIMWGVARDNKLCTGD